MRTMDLPIPWAFNYHLRNGAFKCLAFANFKCFYDARAMILALKSANICGRVLVAEYKKVHPAMIREHISAIKYWRIGQNAHCNISNSTTVPRPLYFAPPHSCDIVSDEALDIYGQPLPKYRAPRLQHGLSFESEAQIVTEKPFITMVYNVI